MGALPVRKFAIAIALLTMPAVARASDWRVATQVSETPAGRALGFIDAEATLRTGDRATFWALLIFRPGRRGFDNAIFHFAADCTNHSYESVRVFTFRGVRSFGKQGPTERGRAAPGSAIFDLIETACGARPLDPNGILDPYAFTRRTMRTGWTR